MTYTKTLLLGATITSGLLFTACTSSSVSLKDTYPRSSSGNAYVYKGMNFGSNRTASFKKGVVEGCATAAGDYRKDHTAFKTDEDYKMGWGDGRLQCYNINRNKDRK